VGEGDYYHSRSRDSRRPLPPGQKILECFVEIAGGIAGGIKCENISLQTAHIFVWSRT